MGVAIFIQNYAKVKLLEPKSQIGYKGMSGGLKGLQNYGVSLQNFGLLLLCLFPIV